MKNLLAILTVFVAVFTTSCSGSKSTAISRYDIKGNWQVTNAYLDGASGKLNVTAFDDAALDCFKNSTWSFPNSNYGKYTLANGNCTGGDRQIIWSQSYKNGVNYLNFKRVDGLKRSQSKTVAEGYIMEITSTGHNQFTARTPVYFEGKNIYVVYEFERIK